MSSSALITRIASAGLTAGAAALLTMTPAFASVAPDPSVGSGSPVQTVTRTIEVPATGVQPSQVGLGALAGLSLAGAAALAARSRRQHGTPSAA